MSEASVMSWVLALVVGSELGAQPLDLRLDSSGPLADCPLPKLPNSLNRISFFEDFSARLGDVPYPVPAEHDFSSSGLVVTPIGTPTPNPALVRMTGAGLQANTPGSVAGTGVNVRMRGGSFFDQDQDQQIVRPQMGAGTILNLIGYPLTAYFSEAFEVRYATSFVYGREEGPAWDASWVGGLSLQDTQLTNPSSGALTQWVRNGGIVCQLGRDGVLGVYSRRGTTTTLAASVDLGTETAGAVWTVACGFAASFTPGDDSITGFYKFTAGIDIETLPWQVMGTTVGSLQPLNSAAEVQTPLWEIVNGAEPGIYTLYQRYIGGCYTREEAAGEAAP